MVDGANALALMIVAPFALISDVIAIVVIVHYYPFFHGTDVLMMSLLGAMAANAIFVLPIPAYLELTSIPWNPGLCMAYVWCFITFRMVQVISLITMSLQWSTMLKMSADKKKYFSTKILRIVAIFVWLVSSIVGLLPIIGAANESYRTNNHCYFLGYNLGAGYAIFFLIFNVAAMFVSVVCGSDATFLIKHMRKVAEVKYKTGRFYLPDKRSSVPSDGTSLCSERYHRLNFAWDLCKFVLQVVLICFLLNHFPFAVIEGAQVFSKADRARLETVVLWLIAVEALLLPHALWLLSRRYRHALVYIIRVYILRQTDVEEEDPLQCTLQSYTPKERERASTVTSRAPSIIGHNGLRSLSGTLRSTTSGSVRFKDYIQPNGGGQAGLVENLQSYVLHSPHLRKQNGVTHGEVQVENIGLPEYMRLDLRERPVDVGPDVAMAATSAGTSASYLTDRTDRDETRKSSETSSLQSPTSSKGSMLSPRDDVLRSSSGSSRKDWKEQMRKKHLPPIFVNEGFEGGDPNAVTTQQQQPTSEDVKAMYKMPDNTSSSSLHYYMSSDYHPDYLTDSLPKHRHQMSIESESDGVSGNYDEGDISKILDENSSNRSSLKSQLKDSYGGFEAPKLGARPKLGTMRTIQNLERTGSYTPLDVYGRPVYESEINLEFQGSQMREENEIEFPNSSFPIDEIKTPTQSSFFPQKRPPYVKRQETFDSPNVSIRARQSSLRENNVVDATTSFGRDVSPSPTVSSVDLPSSGSMAVPGSFDSSQTSSDSVFQREPTSNASRESEQDSGHRQAVEEEEVVKTLPDTDREDFGGYSFDSTSSVTLSPYKGGRRKPPWMIDADSDPIESPKVDDMNIDSYRDSALRSGVNLDGSRLIGMGSPVSGIFDEETDKGFEEALEAHANHPINMYTGVGSLCFESIKEEPEDLTSSSSNPFLDEINGNDEDSFKTQAVVSRRSESRSTSSTASITDNVFQTSPGQSPLRNGQRRGVATPIIVTTDVDTELFGDSGFTSGMDTSNLTGDSPNTVDRTEGKLSPWPDSDEMVKDADRSFESDFSDHRQGSVTSTSSRGSGSSEVGVGRRGSSKRLSRVKSFEHSTPTRNKAPPRGKSFEEPGINVEPAYF